MKFSNGCWLFKEGVGCFAPTQVYYTKIADKEVSICAPTHRITERGDTLGGANLTIRITSPMPDVIRVQTDHYMGRRPVTPTFANILGGGFVGTQCLAQLSAYHHRETGAFDVAVDVILDVYVCLHNPSCFCNFSILNEALFFAPSSLLSSMFSLRTHNSVDASTSLPFIAST